MSLERQLKQAALGVVLRHLLRNKQKSKERACRNIIEFGRELSSEKFLEEEIEKLYQELFKSIEYASETEIREWLTGAFKLS